ncbi:transposase [Isoptericola sp. NPDC019693]|uniref:transposase n=1 Tax=Isoptericola sp. NPDC019693 TaxID=3364009 RepID=UPI0037BDEA18
MHRVRFDLPGTAAVHRLWCQRGISTLTAFALAVEIGDWDRFTGASIGSFLGLVPTEHRWGVDAARGKRAHRRDHRDRPRTRRLVLVPGHPRAHAHDLIRPTVTCPDVPAGAQREERPAKGL